MAQWSRIHLPVRGTRVQSLVREEPTWGGAFEPVHHNLFSRAAEPQLGKPVRPGACALQQEGPL